MKLNVKKNRGFTMIELIIVIAILGILAVFALPRFGNFTTQAKTSTRAGVVAALNSSLGVAHAQWVANGSTGSVTLDGGTAIPMNAAGYPDVGFGISSDAACVSLLGNLLTNTNGMTVSYVGVTCNVLHANWNNPIIIFSNQVQ